MAGDYEIAGIRVSPRNPRILEVVYFCGDRVAVYARKNLSLEFNGGPLCYLSRAERSEDSPEKQMFRELVTEILRECTRRGIRVPTQPPESLGEIPGGVGSFALFDPITIEAIRQIPPQGLLAEGAERG